MIQKIMNIYGVTGEDNMELNQYKVLNISIEKRESKRHLYSMEFILEFVSSHLEKSHLHKTTFTITYNPYGEFYNIHIYTFYYEEVNKLLKEAFEILNKEYSR